MKGEVRLTPKMRAWLTLLRDDGPAPRPFKSNVGFRCATRGFAEWVYETRSGERICAADAQGRYGDQWWDEVKNTDLEAITEAGRIALGLAQAQEGGTDE